jgi:FkbH-like protein
VACDEHDVTNPPANIWNPSRTRATGPGPSNERDFGCPARIKPAHTESCDITSRVNVHDEKAKATLPNLESLTSSLGLTDSVKLVIWDLDETLWTGTLSEGPVTMRDHESNVVRQLNRRGIMNSICSKNDFEAVRAQLRSEDNLWDEFVFPKISWAPKGPQIAQIVEDMQLRPKQVLFIDDNPTNIQEAIYSVPGIQTSGPHIIADLLSLPQLAGGNDPQLKRLGQYRLLEQKAQERTENIGTNDDFLRSCNIQVEIGDDCLTEDNFPRIAELVERTNQLNFTKRRLDSDELRAILSDPQRENRYVRVRDRFGDYGICGFYSLAAGHLSDFLFSCRILHMGVEQWIYVGLGCPSIDVAGEVATPLDSTYKVDWINQENRTFHFDAVTRERSMAGSKVLLKGACDLVAVNDFLGGALETEFNVITAAGLPEHRDHTEIIRRSTSETISKYGPIIDRLPFLDRSSYSSRIFETPNYGYLVLSVLTDYTQGIYRYRDTDFLVPFGVYDRDITDLDLWDRRASDMAWMGLQPEFIRWFSENFEFQGPLSPEAFKENIRWLSKAIPSTSRLVLVNGAEVDMGVPSEQGRHLRHREMNRALDEVVRELSNASILDVRGFITSRDDLTDSPRHYRRSVYLRMAEALRDVVTADIQVKRVTKTSMRSSLRKISNQMKRRLPHSMLRVFGEVKKSFTRS